MPIEVLSRITHQALRLRQSSATFGFARSHLLMTLLGGELVFAVHTFPIAFSITDAKANLVGLMGLNEDGNLFVGQHDHWLSTYTPAALRAWPFSLQNVEDGSHTVLIDTDSYNLSTVDGTPLFDNGVPTKALNEIVEFLQSCALNQTQTDRAMAAIETANLLVPWSVKATLPDGQPATLQGLFQIDFEKFDALGDEAFSLLRREGALPIIFAHLYSLRNIAHLERLARERGPKASAATIAEFSVLTDDYLKF